MLWSILHLAPLAPLFSLISHSLATPLDARQSNFADPNDDAFYHPTVNLATLQPGQIIANRSVTSRIITPGSPSFQISFRTTGNNGDQNTSVATVWAPATKVLSPPRILAYQFAEDADNLDCNPSYFWVSSNSHAQIAEGIEGPIVIPWALDQGYYVVSTDAEGPASAWLVGNIEGQAVLDAIRATIHQFGLSTSTQVALYGYSGGAHSTVWASTLQATYAKELNIVGAAFGGTPIDLGQTFDTVNGSPVSILAGAALFGLANSYRNLDTELNRLLTPQGVTIRNNLRARNNCTGGTTTSLDYNTVFTGGNIRQNPIVASVLTRESLLNGTRTPVPNFPRLEYHGTNDTIVPFGPEQTYVNQQCTNNPNTKLFFTPFTGQDHAPTALLGLPGALGFVRATLSGSAPSGQCGGSSVSFPLPGSQGSIDILGSDRDKQLQQSVTNRTAFNG